MSLHVAKFGGTSMKDESAISSVADVIEGMSSSQKIAVVSATSGTTDTLIELGHLALNNNDWEVILNNLITRHDKIIKALEIDLDLTPFWDSLQERLQGISLVHELSPTMADFTVTFGERTSSQILAALLRKRGLKSEALDAFHFVYTDNNYGSASVDFEKTSAEIQKVFAEHLENGVIPVVTGFLGQSLQGNYSTLGRGGSDYTGAIVAAALNAEELQIWTDVDGIYNADPNIFEEAVVLPKISCLEAGELAFFGAKVLHPKTIKPAVASNIPVRILNTFNPEAPGTLIVKESEESIKSVTYRKHVDIISVTSSGMLAAKAFLAQLFEVFALHEISVDVVSTSEVSVSCTVDKNMSDKVVSYLEKIAHVEVQKEMSIVCLVGEGIKTNSGILGELFSAVSGHGISMISQGASKRNVTFVVPDNEVSEVVKKVFNQFFKK